MLYSTNPELIFVKTRKTAGSSTEAVLQRALFNHTPEDHEEWQVVENGFCVPRMVPRPSLPSRDRKNLRQWQGWSRDAVSSIADLRTHATPGEIREALGDDVWSRSLKVVNVRNPFDLLVSMYFFRPMDPRPSFEDWVMSHPGLNADSPLGLLMNGVLDEVNDDWFVIRYEQLNADIEHLLTRLGVQGEIDIPNFKSSTRASSDRDYTTFFTEASRRRVEAAWPRWFDKFGYSF